MEMHAKPSGKFSLSIPCVPSMFVFIGGVSPSKCNYYSTSLQQSYSQNIPGRTRNFPITVVSGLQLRCAPLPQAAIFATTNLIALAEDFPSRAGQFERLRPTDRRPLYSSLVLRFNARAAWSSHTFGVQSEDTPKTNIFSTHPQFQRTCRLVFAYLRHPDRRWCPQQ